MCLPDHCFIYDKYIDYVYFASDIKSIISQKYYLKERYLGLKIQLSKNKIRIFSFDLKKK